MKYNGGSSIKNTTNSSFNTSSNINDKLRKLNEELDQLEVAVASLTTSVSSVNAKVGTDDVAHQIEVAKTEINNAIGESVETAELSATDATITNANVDTLTVDTIDTTGDRINILSNIATGSIYQRYSTIVPSDKAFIIHPNSIVRIGFSNKYAIVFNSSQGNSIIITNVSDKIRYFVSGSSLYINVTEEASISCIGQTPTITNLQDTDFVFVKSGTNVLGPLYADLAQANLQNITITNTLSAKTISAENVNISEDLTVSGTVHADIDADNIQADEIEVEDISADRLNSSQIHTKVEKENLGYTTIPAHQSTELYAISVPVTNGLWEIELENSLRATLNKTNAAVEITYWRSSEDSLPLIGIKDDKLFIYTRDSGKVYFSNNTLENIDTTVEIYAPTSPNYPVVEDLDEKFEIATNNGVVNTSTTYVKDLVITGSCKYDGESEINVDILSVDDKIIAQGVCGLENQVLTTDCDGKTVWAYGLSSVNDTECSCDSDKVITKKALTDYNGVILDDVYKYPITNLGNNTCVHGNFSARREIYGGSAGNYTSCEVNNKSITTIKSTSSGGQWSTQYCDINSVRTDVDNSIIKSEYCSFYGPSASTSRLCGSEVKTTKDNVVIASGTNASNCKCIILNKDMACIKAPLQVTGDTTISGAITANCFCGNATSANNATCFNGCTYSEACIDIRDGLATQTCADAIQNCANFIQSCVSAIEEKIPAQASASNQLADKDFVNSSIATNTANFRGTYACVAELPSTGNTNNDYAFVCSLNTTTGNYIYDRYKWVASASCWECEYELNTTGFTAEQLASINSGITSNLVAKITDVYDNTVTVCMNGECKGSFSLNQNIDSVINLGCEICNAKCFDGCTYADAKADIRAGLLAVDAAASLCANRILSWDATNSMAKTMSTSCACNLDVINNARICGRLEVGSVGKGRLCVGDDYVCLKDCSGDSIFCVSDTHVCMRTPSNYIDLEDNGKITFQERDGCLYQFCNEHIKYSCDNGSTWNNVVTQAETICTVCTPTGDAYESPLSWGANDYLYYIPAISMSNCNGTIRMRDFYNGAFYYTYLAHSRDKLYIGNGSTTPSSYFYPNPNCSDGTMIWHGDVDGTVSTAASTTNSTCFNGCTYDCAKADIRAGLTGCTGTVTSVNVSVNGVSGTAVTSSGTVTLTNVPPYFANNTYYAVGDDSAIGDVNLAGMIGLKSLNNDEPGISFRNSANTELGRLYASGNILNWSGNQTIAGTLTATTLCGNLCGNATTANTATNATCLGGRTSAQYIRNCDGADLGPNAQLGTYHTMTTSSGLTSCWTHLMNFAWTQNQDIWSSQLAIPTSHTNHPGHMAFRSKANNSDWASWHSLIDDKGGQTIAGNLTVHNSSSNAVLCADSITLTSGKVSCGHYNVYSTNVTGQAAGTNVTLSTLVNCINENTPIGDGDTIGFIYSHASNVCVAFPNGKSSILSGGSIHFDTLPNPAVWATSIGTVSTTAGWERFLMHSADTTSCAIMELPYLGPVDTTSLKVCGMTVASNATCPISLTCGSYKVELDCSAGVAIGKGATVSNATTGSISIGCGTYTYEDGGIAIGYNAQSECCEAIAIGEGAEAGDEYSVAIGCGVAANGLNSIAIGLSAYAQATDSIAIGCIATASCCNAIAIGEGAYAGARCSIAIGCGACAGVITRSGTTFGCVLSDIRKGDYRDVAIHTSSNIMQCELYKAIASRIDLSKDLATQCICNIPDINCSLLVRGSYNNLGISSIVHQKYSGMCTFILTFSDNSYISVNSLGSNVITNPMYLEITGLSV